MLVDKGLYNWSYDLTQHFVSDSIVLRQFCTLYLEAAPDDTTLIRWANQIGPKTVASLNERAVQLARSLKVTRGRKLRVDAIVVETNVHHPTDSAQSPTLAARRVRLHAPLSCSDSFRRSVLGRSPMRRSAARGYSVWPMLVGIQTQRRLGWA